MDFYHFLKLQRKNVENRSLISMARKETNQIRGVSECLNLLASLGAGTPIQKMTRQSTDGRVKDSYLTLTKVVGLSMAMEGK